MRALLEALPAPDLEELRQETFAEFGGLRTAVGIPMQQGARFVVVERAG
jgi:hypothetical protein